MLTVDDWMKKFIDQLLHIVHGQWIYRNVSKHHATLGSIRRAERRQLLLEIDRLVSLRPEEVPEESKFLLEMAANGLPDLHALDGVVQRAAAFAEAATEAGVDGILLVDLPPEEAAEFRAGFSPAGLELILLASPTTSEARIAQLCAEGEGYLYYVSYAGVTGADRLDTGSVTLG